MAGGRPTKFKPEFCEQARKLCSLNATNVQIADFFGIDQSTLTRWKQANEKFRTALKESKEAADNKVERSLFERAMGYSCPETKVFCQNGEVTKVETRKHFPPDATSMIFWLKNRQPDKWRDKQEIAHSGDGLSKLFDKLDSDSGLHNDAGQ